MSLYLCFPRVPQQEKETELLINWKYKKRKKRKGKKEKIQPIYRSIPFRLQKIKSNAIGRKYITLVATRTCVTTRYPVKKRIEYAFARGRKEFMLNECINIKYLKCQRTGHLIKRRWCKSKKIILLLLNEIRQLYIYIYIWMMSECACLRTVKLTYVPMCWYIYVCIYVYM